jgi:hypothetical protein
MTENSAIFNARHGAGSFHPHRQPAPTAQDCLKRGNGANWRTTRQLSGECRLGSVAGCPARHSRLSDFLSMIEEAMTITPIIFVLVILLFGFDSAGQVKTRRKHTYG